MTESSFHNACVVRPTSPRGDRGYCADHDVDVYRDGMDWCIIPEPTIGDMW